MQTKLLVLSGLSFFSCKTAALSPALHLRERRRLRRPERVHPAGEGGDRGGGQQGERAREETASEGVSQPHGQQVHHDHEEQADVCQGGPAEEEADP